MAQISGSKKLRPETDVLTRGFDPSLSVGSARPAVFRSSTYVFSSPEAAERAFDIMGGRGRRAEKENVDLVYSRFNHPNAEILEDQILPLEPDAAGAVAFNSGMAAIMTALLAVLEPGDSIVYTVPIYGGTQTLIQGFLKTFGIEGIAVEGGQGRRYRPGSEGREEASCRAGRESRESDDHHDRHQTRVSDDRWSGPG